MTELIAFAQRVKDLLATANREPHWSSDEAEQYMKRIAERRMQYERLVLQLTESVVQPRLETLAAYFSNASITSREPKGHCSCWFGYCERFPVTTKLAFTFEHDVRFETLAVCFEASMMPVFIKLNERDRLILALNAVNLATVKEWVESRLLEFLGAYLQIDRGGEDFLEDVTTDPVCGMRIGRSVAVASESYYGHPYFFCSHDCHRRFKLEPTAYVQAKAM